MASVSETGSTGLIKIRIRSKIKIVTDKIQTRYCVKVVSDCCVAIKGFAFAILSAFCLSFVCTLV